MNALSDGKRDPHHHQTQACNIFRPPPLAILVRAAVMGEHHTSWLRGVSTAARGGGWSTLSCRGVGWNCPDEGSPLDSPTGRGARPPGIMRYHDGGAGVSPWGLPQRSKESPPPHPHARRPLPPPWLASPLIGQPTLPWRGGKHEENKRAARATSDANADEQFGKGNVSNRLENKNRAAKQQTVAQRGEEMCLGATRAAPVQDPNPRRDTWWLGCWSLVRGHLVPPWTHGRTSSTSGRVMCVRPLTAHAPQETFFSRHTEEVPLEADGFCGETVNAKSQPERASQSPSHGWSM